MARLVFLGTPDAAVEPLRTLVDAGHDVVMVVSRPDKRRGRGGSLHPSPVKAAAIELGLEVTDILDDILAVSAELGVVVAYGRIIPEAVLDNLPMVNLHFSLLPRWRGAAPVERAILEGDAETGVCLMAVEAGLDTGGIYAQSDTTIGDDETVEELRSRLVVMGSRLLEEHLKDGIAGLPIARDQRGSPSYAEKILPAEHEIHWDQPAVQIHRVVRLGRAWTTFRGRRLRILRATEAPIGAATEMTTETMTEMASGMATEMATGTGDPEPAAIVIGETPADRRAPGTLEATTVTTGSEARIRMVTVQPEGRRPMDAQDWLRGVRPMPDERLGA
jgi:methionyl-tRNA formyltransferase